VYPSVRQVLRIMSHTLVVWCFIGRTISHAGWVSIVVIVVIVKVDIMTNV